MSTNNFDLFPFQNCCCTTPPLPTRESFVRRQSFDSRKTSNACRCVHSNLSPDRVSSSTTHTAQQQRTQKFSLHQIYSKLKQAMLTAYKIGLQQQIESIKPIKLSQNRQKTYRLIDCRLTIEEIELYVNVWKRQESSSNGDAAVPTAADRLTSQSASRAFSSRRPPPYTKETTTTTHYAGLLLLRLGRLSQLPQHPPHCYSAAQLHASLAL